MGLNFVQLMVLFHAIFGQTGHRLPPLLPRSYQQRSTNAPSLSMFTPQLVLNIRQATAAKFCLEIVPSTRRFGAFVVGLCHFSRQLRRV